MKVSKYIEQNKENGEQLVGKPESFEEEPVHSHKKATAAPQEIHIPANSAEIHVCPECGGPVEHEGGCVICRNCGFSKCG